MSSDSHIRPPLARRLLRAHLCAALFGLLAFFSFAPFGQFYLAWLAPVPLLWSASRARGPWRAFGAGYVAGLCYFGSSLWYIVVLGIFPVLGLTAYLAVYVGLFAMIWRPLASRPLLGVVGAATVWVGLEWLRGVMFTGLPYVFLGHSQSPLLAGIQVADGLGAYGVSWWTMLLAATLWQVAEWGVPVVRARRERARQMLVRPRNGLTSEAPPEPGEPTTSVTTLIPTLLVTLAVLAGVFGYGFWRLGETIRTPGPRVMLLQPNFPLRNDTPLDEPAYLAWHRDTTRDALAAEEGRVDLVVWSESVLPYVNPESRSVPFRAEYRRDLVATDALLRQVSRGRPSVIAGGGYAAGWAERDGGRLAPADRRNSAYFYAGGEQSPQRYDKRHLVPFGEYMPFRTWPAPVGWLYPLFTLFHPWGSDWELTAGGTRDVFLLPGGARAVTPICFEDIVPERVRELVYDDAGVKRADVIVNVTNDGWFRGTQQAQHLQAALFRSVENRAPTVRAVNTGISAVVDSTGRVVEQLAAHEPGVLVATVPLDERSTLFGRVGDAFAIVCATATLLVAMLNLARRFVRRKSQT